MFRKSKPKLQPQSQAPDSVSGVLDVASARIRAIVEAAETASREIRAEIAKSEAFSDNPDQISKSQLVSSLAESLTARADELSREAQQLSDVLSRAGSRIRKSEGVATEPPAAPQPSPPAPAKPAGPQLAAKVSERFAGARPDEGGADDTRFRRRASSRAADRSATRSTEGVRLLATQMAVAGSSRDEIEERLRSEFGIDDPSEFLGDLRTSA